MDVTEIDLCSVDHVLTTTRAVRRRLDLGRAVESRRRCNDERGVGAVHKYFGWIRRVAGRVAPKRPRRRLESGRVALDANLTVGRVHTLFAIS